MDVGIPVHWGGNTSGSWENVHYIEQPKILFNNTSGGQFHTISPSVYPDLIASQVWAQFDLPARSTAYIRPSYGNYSGKYTSYSSECGGVPEVKKISIWYAEDRNAPNPPEEFYVLNSKQDSLTYKYYTKGDSPGNNSVTLSWSAADDVGTLVETGGGWTISGISYYELYESATLLPTPTGLSTTLNRLEGEYNYSLKAVDKAGNKSDSSGPFTIVVDRTPPNNVTDLHLSTKEYSKDGIDYTNLNAPFLSCTVPEDKINYDAQNSQIPNSTTNSNHYTIFFAGDPAPAPTTRTDEAIDSTPLPALDNGVYTVAVRYYDNAGNIEISDISEDEYYTFAIDTAKPSVPASLTATVDGIQLPKNSEGIYETYKRNVTLGWQPSNDKNPDKDWQSGIAGYTIYRYSPATGGDGWSIYETASATETGATLTLDNEDNQFRITAMDNAGNESDIRNIIIRKYDILLPVTFPKTPGEAVTYTNNVPTLHWFPPDNTEPSLNIGYKVSILKDNTVIKTSGGTPVTTTAYTIQGLPTKSTYTAIVYARDSIDRTSENSIKFTPGNVPLKIGPSGEYDVMGPANNASFNTAADLSPQFGLTKSPPRHDGEGDLVLHKLFYKKQGASEYIQYPEADGDYTSEPISLSTLSRGTYEWYMEIAEFYDPGSGVPNKFDSKQRWPVTTTVTMSFTIRDNTTTGGYSDVIKTTPGKPVSFDAGTYLDATGTNICYNWDFGDGTVLNQDMEASKTHSFTMNPSKEWIVRITAINGEGNTFGPVYIQVIVENTTRGALYADEDWSGDHPLYGSVTVPAGITLTIHAGTNVKAYGNGDTKLDIKGKLEIWGSDGSEVHIQSVKQAGDSDWQGIIISGSADFSNCIIENAKRGVTCANTKAGDVSIGSTTFENNLVGLHSLNATALVGSCRFEDNTWYGIKEDNPTADRRPEVTGSTFTHNGYDYYHYKLKNISITKLNEINGLDATRQNKEGE
jgi:hypothetical protein